MTKVVALIQARMGSSRLPGKVLKPVMGRPMLWYLVQRLKQCQYIDEIAVATSSDVKDLPLLDFAAENGLGCYAGSENDLVDRLYQAGMKFDADAIVRVTGDCPLVDPVLADRVIKKYLDAEGALDCATNCQPRTYPDGLDVALYAMRALGQVWREVQDPFNREWFSCNFYEHPEKYTVGAVYQAQDLSKLRWTLDYPEDLEFIREVLERLHCDSKTFLMQDVLDLLREHPELAEINRAYVEEDGYLKALEARRREDPSSA